MQRTDVNPWEWSKAFGFSQAVELSGAERVLVCSGQTAVGPDGAPPSTSEMGEQVSAALANLRTVLDAAGMALTDVVQITAFTTDVDALFGAWGTVIEAFSPNLPAATAVGVTRLAFPELKVELEAIAAK